MPKTASTPRAFYVAPEADTAYYAQEILTPEDLIAGLFSLFRRHVVEEAHQNIATGALDSDSAGDMTIPAITSAADGTGHGNILGSTDTDHAIPATIERFAESVFLLDLFHVFRARALRQERHPLLLYARVAARHPKGGQQAHILTHRGR